jgi:transposase-like protein
MAAVVPSYKGFRFPVEIISHCVWLYHRFPLSFREGVVNLFGPTRGGDPPVHG